MENSGTPQNRSDVPFLVRMLATGVFTGYSPVAPGTAGSLLGVGLYLIPGMREGAVLLAAIAVVFLAGTAAARRMERQYGEDPPVVVIDEVVGMWISLLMVEPATPASIAAAFVFFRIYDTLKPPPARWMEKLSGGWGIMLDDVIAAVYANISTRLLILLVLKG
jgi:phosphatidylglycerophosphatase A